MIRTAILSFFFAALVFAQKTPLRHYWPANTNTTPEAFLASIAADYGLSQPELASLRLAKDYTTQHNGVRHLIYRQQWQGIEVSGAEYSINIAPDGTILNAGGTLYPNPGDSPYSPMPRPSAPCVPPSSASIPSSPSPPPLAPA